METQEGSVDNAIPIEDVRRTISAINSATCGIFSNGQDYYVDKSDMNSDHAVNEGNRIKVEKLYSSLRPEFGHYFPETVDPILRNDSKLHGKIYVLIDERDPENNLVKIACGSAQDSSLRRYPIFFEFNFGKNRDTVIEFSDKIDENPFYIKSIAERIFSPNSNPPDSLLRGNMSTLDKRNISPFINLPYVKEVITKTISN